MRHLSFFLFSLLLAFSAFAQTTSNPPGAPPAQIQSLELPSDAVLLTELVTPIEARQLKQGDIVEAQVIKDLKRGKQLFVKAGTRLQGRVVSVQSASTAGADTVLSIMFDRARTKSGQLFATQLTLQALAPASNIEGNSDSMMSGRGLQDNRIQAAGGDPKRSTVTGNIGQLNESSRGVYYLPGMKLATETGPDGIASMITWTRVDPIVRKGAQLVFTAAAH